MNRFFVVVALVLVACAAPGAGPGGYYDPSTDPVVAPATPYQLTSAQLAEAKRRVARVMKDPMSAQFEDIRAFQRSGTVTICGQINAKNGFGGYTGFSPFAADMAPATGVISNMVVPGDDDYATKDFVNRRCAV